MKTLHNNSSMSNISFDNIIYNNISNITYNITNITNHTNHTDHTNHDIDDDSSHKIEDYHWILMGFCFWMILGTLLALNRLINNANDGGTELCDCCCDNPGYRNNNNNQYNENRCCNCNETVKQKIQKIQNMLNMLNICVECSILLGLSRVPNSVSNTNEEDNVEEDAENIDDSTIVEIQPKIKDNNNIIFKEKDLNTIINTKPNCTICLETINESHLVATKCNHYFCYQCIINHLDEDNRCPNCRQLIGNTLYKDSLA